MSKEISLKSSAAEFLLFTAAGGENTIEVRFETEMIWATQKMIAQLFETSVDNVSLHLKNIFLDHELDEDSVVEEYSVTALDGKNYRTKHYSLDAIVSVGYRVNSTRATQFRKWATGVLQKYTIQGYVLDKERMKNGAFLSQDYFEKLLSEIREIRLSERRFYQKITDIYATSMDYDRSAKSTKKFFAEVQNKLHYAIHGQTAAEVIACRVDAEKDHMGMSTWEAAPTGKIQKYDVSIAKNCLTDKKLKSLERIVTMYLDFAEYQAERNIPMTMQDWSERLGVFLTSNRHDILLGPGMVSAKIAKQFAESEFEKYRLLQDRIFESDFDKFLEVAE